MPRTASAELMLKSGINCLLIIRILCLNRLLFSVIDGRIFYLQQCHVKIGESEPLVLFPSTVQYPQAMAISERVLPCAVSAATVSLRAVPVSMILWGCAGLFA